MRLTRLTRLLLPLAFLFLGALSTGLLLVLRYAPVLPTVVAAVVSAVVATLVWMAAIGEEPSMRRGAVVGAVASVLGPFIALFPTTVALNVQATAGYGAPLFEFSVSDLFLAYILLTGALLLVPLAAAAGAFAARFPAVAPPSLQTVDVPRIQVPDASRTRRQLGALALVVCLLVGSLAVVQYTDPTTPSVGDAPAYAGADAPASVQSQQALARSRSVSHTVRIQTYRVHENGTRGGTYRFVVRHDLQRDVIRTKAVNAAGNPSRSVTTEDADWHCWCDGEPSKRPPSNIPPQTGYYLELPTDRGVSVVEETAETVTLRYAEPQTWDGRSVETPLDQTVTIDREMGRLRSMTIRWEMNGNETWRTRVRFENYRDTRAAPPAHPGRPLRLHVRDLLRGPLNGETPLHQWGEET